MTTRSIKPGNDQLVAQTFVPLSPYADLYAVTAGGTATATVPSNAKFVVFSAGAEFYVKPGGTASATAASDGTASIRSPGQRCILGDTTLGLFSVSAQSIGLEWFF
jgi:hypothetical protein